MQMKVKSRARVPGPPFALANNFYEVYCLSCVGCAWHVNEAGPSLAGV